MNKLAAVNATLVVGMVCLLLTGVFTFVCGMAGTFNNADWGAFLPTNSVRTATLGAFGMLQVWLAYCVATKLDK